MFKKFLWVFFCIFVLFLCSCQKEGLYEGSTENSTSFSDIFTENITEEYTEPSFVINTEESTAGKNNTKPFVTEKTEIYTVPSEIFTEPETVITAAVTENNTESLTCTFLIECGTVFRNSSYLQSGMLDILPPDGVIFPLQTVEFYESETVFELLSRLCRENSIHMESSWTPVYNSAYVEGINNLYEFDCGGLSGWMYCVNGVFPNYGCSKYTISAGDRIEWHYTCDLGADIGGGTSIGG